MVGQAAREALPDGLVGVDDDGPADLLVAHEARERRRIALVVHLGRVHADDAEAARAVAVEPLAVARQHVAAVGAAEGPEVDDDDAAAQRTQPRQLGRNRAIIPQLRDAMSSLQRRGLGSLIHSYAGCFAPKFVNRDPTAMLSHHSWGVAFDCNFAGNAYGELPHQDPRLVRTMERFGFIWGGTFIVPDGNHFEYRRAPATSG